AAQGPEPYRLPEGAVGPFRALPPRGPEEGAARNDQELLILDDDPVAALGRRLRPALGRNEGALQAVDIERQIDAEWSRNEPRSPTSPGWAARQATGRG